ncbi:MAG: family 1 glycosylhydrolase, partial [Candidatus Sabulitectum sp.]|nr:family 1 glycosylhydrolase [Candidatus Sabulitectum sp.]
LARHVVADTGSQRGYRILQRPASYPHMHAPWIKVSPEITYWAPRFLSEIWGVKAIYLTENGCACDDVVDDSGEVNDTDRIFYLRNHLHQAQRAAEEGIPLLGYFCWSLLDNFEWADGYTYRFGIVHVDFETLKRTPKLSSEYLSQVISSKRVL